MTLEPITDKQLKEITEKMKVHFPNWATKVSEGISKEKDWKAWTNNPCTEQNARHISTGTIKGQMHRRLYMRVAARMILDAIQENTEINELVKQSS